MVTRLKFPLAVLALFVLAAWAPSRSHAQASSTPGEVGQQGDFQGENTDTGAAAVDNVNDKGGSEAIEAGETTETAAAAAATSGASRVDEGSSESAESAIDLDRVEDQVSDQTALDEPNR